MNRKKKLMILGAGVFQVAAIRRAVELGYHVISVDYRPDNIGHRYSHEYVNASTIDCDAVLDAARQRHIDGIFTMASDIALPTVATVASELELPGPGEHQVATLIEKNRFRVLQAGVGLDCPTFVEASDFGRAVTACANSDVVLKPAVSSGSRGVVRVERLTHGSKALFETAREFSYNGKVCIEEYIDGDDFSVEGFIGNGAVVQLVTTRKHVQGFAVVGHCVPSRLGPELESRIRRQIEVVLSAVGYIQGPFDADFRCTQERVVLLEITPRLGGNGMPVLAERACGVPLIDWSIGYAMNDLNCADVAAVDHPQAACSVILLYSERAGTVTSAATEDSIRLRVPGVVEICMDVRPGARVERFRHGGHVLGYCLVEPDPGVAFDEIAARVRSALKLKVI